VQHKRILALKKLFGENNVFPIPLNNEQEQEFFSRIDSCFMQGVKIILFSTGGIEIRDGDWGHWVRFYEKLFGDKIFQKSEKNILPLYIDPEKATAIQGRIGDRHRGLEIFPEIHYTISTIDRFISVPIEVGDIFTTGKEKVFSSEKYKKIFKR
jgi:hypothetical protein